MIFIVSFVIFAVLMTAMAVGVIAGRAPISGSCGGVGKILGTPQKCEICGDDPTLCESEQARASVETGTEPGVHRFHPSHKSIR